MIYRIKICIWQVRFLVFFLENSCNLFIYCQLLPKLSIFIIFNFISFVFIKLAWRQWINVAKTSPALEHIFKSNTNITAWMHEYCIICSVSKLMNHIRSIITFRKRYKSWIHFKNVNKQFKVESNDNDDWSKSILWLH